MDLHPYPRMLLWSIFLQTEILTTYFGRFKRIYYLIAIGVITIITNLFISQKMVRFTVIDNSIIKIIITGVSVVVIPLISFFFIRREAGRCEKQS